MNPKFITLILSVNIFFCQSYAQSPKDSSIALFYEGSLMRQVPIVVFHLPHAARTIYDSAHVFKIEVTEKEYCSIEKRVNVIDKYSKDSSLSSPYEFIVRKKDSLVIISTFSLKYIREAFWDIVNAFKDYRKRKHVEDVLNNVYKCMEFEYY